jgi:SAM-dependent methyltransferase
MSRAPEIDLPADFDRDFYVAQPGLEPLRAGGLAEARHHYERYGRAEGRATSPIHDRPGFWSLPPPGLAALEIGPGPRPSLRPPRFDVRYLEAFDTPTLRAQVARNNWGDPAEVPHIDFVWSGQPYREIIDARFDLAASSHNIEHQPDLVRHLNDVADILRPGGWFFLIVPDKRYCFDHFLPETTLGDVLEAHLERRTRHAARHVLDHWLGATHNYPEPHWNGLHGEDPAARAAEETGVRIRSALTSLAAQVGYHDTHAWRFTPESFRHIVAGLFHAGLHPLRLERVYPTIHGSFEFFAVLRRAD